MNREDDFPQDFIWGCSTSCYQIEGAAKEDGKKAVLTGNPVRSAFASPPDRREACDAFGLDPSIPVVLVSGGSQGAHSINAAMAQVVKDFLSGHHLGAGYHERSGKRPHVLIDIYLGGVGQNRLVLVPVQDHIFVGHNVLCVQ